jgi:hypothetical protein
MGFFNVKNFLTYGGWVLVIVGILGFFLIGPTAEQSVFGSAWWFDNAENWAHLVLGIVALLLVYAVKNADLNKWVTVLVGVFALVVTVAGFMDPSFLGANLENPLDNVLHLVVGLWALISGFSKSM